MKVDNFIKPITFSTSELPQFNQKRETFYDLLQQMLKTTSGMRPPKVELTGLLVPCDLMVKGRNCKFKLETDSEEFFLFINEPLASIARKLEWDPVTVKGYLDVEDQIEVEKIYFAEKVEQNKPLHGFLDSFFDFDQYSQLIARNGKLDIAPEYLAS